MYMHAISTLVKPNLTVLVIRIHGNLATANAMDTSRYQHRLHSSLPTLTGTLINRVNRPCVQKGNNFRGSVCGTEPSITRASYNLSRNSILCSASADPDRLSNAPSDITSVRWVACRSRRLV